MTGGRDERRREGGEERERRGDRRKRRGKKRRGKGKRRWEIHIRFLYYLIIFNPLPSPEVPVSTMATQPLRMQAFMKADFGVGSLRTVNAVIITVQ